ncbi:BAG family molecular chaperone regulator 1-like isoform X2 [Phoenix dactylifera]|uniref:BAG family molecular chaperone regulator 1-like isoform X2 n=1 Tax=Phoenix dactylifera TaxID=42345 RepID=A0A8B7CMU3_PHODC|nr:BAG family molecular chaperone regulator 1-like isoform X2 [Phoenix dactylifera]
MRRTGSDGGPAAELEEAGREVEWEMRPGGMLVQKRPADPGAAAAPEVRVRISYGPARYEVSVSSLATFGELKKLLTAETGLQPGEQRLMYRGKERRDGEYLDLCGVKNLSKMVLVQDPTSLERRYVEMRRNARIHSAQRTISDVSLEVDKLADQAKRVQKCVEILDVLKISNARLNPVVITTKWEIFDPPTTTRWEFFD